MTINRESVSGWVMLIISAVAAVVTLITAIATFFTALAAYNQSTETHKLFNSRMTEMLKIVQSEAAAKATLAEKAREETKEAIKTAGPPK